MLQWTMALEQSMWDLRRGRVGWEAEGNGEEGGGRGRRPRQASFTSHGPSVELPRACPCSSSAALNAVIARAKHNQAHNTMPPSYQTLAVAAAHATATVLPEWAQLTAAPATPSTSSAPHTPWTPTSAPRPASAPRRASDHGLPARAPPPSPAGSSTAESSEHHDDAAETVPSNALSLAGSVGSLRSVAAAPPSLQAVPGHGTSSPSPDPVAIDPGTSGKQRIPAGRLTLTSVRSAGPLRAPLTSPTVSPFTPGRPRLATVLSKMIVAQDPARRPHIHG